MCQCNSRLLQRHVRDVILLPQTFTDITLWRVAVALAAILVPYFCSRSNFYCRRHVRHIAQYHDVLTGRMMWVNGRDHYQLEPVLPEDQLTLDRRPLRHCPTVNYAATVYSRIPLFCSVPAFDILRL